VEAKKDKKEKDAGGNKAMERKIEKAFVQVVIA